MTRIPFVQLAQPEREAIARSKLRDARVSEWDIADPQLKIVRMQL